MIAPPELLIITLPLAAVLALAGEAFNCGAGPQFEPGISRHARARTRIFLLFESAVHGGTLGIPEDSSNAAWAGIRKNAGVFDAGNFGNGAGEDSSTAGDSPLRENAGVFDVPGGHNADVPVRHITSAAEVTS